MQEDFIHYLWKFKKLSGQELLTTDGEAVKIKSLGTHNLFSGPDFFNARLEIDGQDWAGNIEMHIKASDWYLHGHDDDPAYANVILHVVWTHDAEITRRDGVDIPVLEVSQYVDPNLTQSYRQLFDVKNNQFINCEPQFSFIDSFKRDQWLEKLFIERLSQKSDRIQHILDQNTNDWEAAFFQLLSRSFGTKTNADAFEQLASSINQSVVRKLANDALQLEAVLLGQAGLLQKSRKDSYYKDLAEAYAFAKAKYQLHPSLTPMKFFRLRPANYPTIRISQLARLYQKKPVFFGALLLAKSRTDIHQLFEVQAAQYWDTHHVFDKRTDERQKVLTTDFIDLLIINCIVPIKFMHAKTVGSDIIEELLEIMYQLKPEKNKVTRGFKTLFKVENALQTQSLLQLKPNYCDVNKCLSCDIGIALLRS